MSKIITFGTLKGGTGKTMNLFNLAGILAGKGRRILLIDVDPQCNLSADCGIDISDMAFTTVNDIFSKYKTGNILKAADVIIEHPINNLENLDIIPSSILLFNIEETIMQLEDNSKILQQFIKGNQKHLEKYDYIFIDTNPSMSIFNINAFYIADAIIINTDVSSNSIFGAELFCSLWDAKREQINQMSKEQKEDNIEALLVGNYNKRSNLSKELTDYIHSTDFSKDIVLDTVIPSTVQLKNTEVSHMPINILHKNSAAKKAYENLVAELEKKGLL